MRSDMKEDPTTNYVVKILDLRGQHLTQPDLCRWLPDGWEVVANHCVSMVFLPRLPTTPWPPGPVLDFDHAVDEDGAARIMFAKNNVIIAPTDGAARVEEIVGTAEAGWARQTVFWLEPARYGRIDRELRALQSRAPQRLLVEDLPHGELKAFLEHALPHAAALDDYDRRMLCMPRRHADGATTEHDRGTVARDVPLATPKGNIERLDEAAGNIVTRIEQTQDDFEHWLFEMDDALERFHLSVPVEVRTRLDYSSASLDVLERWLLSQYADHRTLLEPSEGAALDGAARYIGETFRKTIGGKWQVRLETPKYAHYRLPELTGFEEKPTPISPFTLTTACVDRRKGNHLRMILENMARRLRPRS